MHAAGLAEACRSCTDMKLARCIVFRIGASKSSREGIVGTVMP